MSIKKNIKLTLGYLFYYGLYKYIKPKGNRVLIYHAFGSKLEHDTYGISIDLDLFEQHLNYIKSNYIVVPISNANCGKFKNTVSISIDDGYKDNLLAAEKLEKEKIPYIIYISTGKIDTPGYLTRDDISMLSKSKFCTIGSHTVSHIHLAGATLLEKQFEILNSKEQLEEIVGKPVLHFSYPYGSYDEISEELAKKTYKYIATSHIGFNSTSTNLKKIKRIEIVASDSVCDVQRKIKGFYDYLGIR